METFFTPQVVIVIILFAILCLIFLFAGIKVGHAKGHAEGRSKGHAEGRIEGHEQGRKQERLEWEGQRLEEIVKKRLKQSRAVIGGQVYEQIAPLLPDFPFDPGDCRFVGKPIDFIIFKGMNEKNISEVIFLEVKSGTGRNLNEQEKKLRDVIQNHKVSWVEFDI